MIKKAILQTQFGSPHPWTDKFFENFSMLGKYGWDLYVFTKNTFDNVPENVHIIPMSLDKFDELIKKYIGVEPNNYIDPSTNAPHKLVSDYYPAYGLIFQDYFKADYWGHTNWDVVFGRIDHFVSDERLSSCDIFGASVNEVDGIFTMYKNNTTVNTLFTHVSGWEKMFTNHGLFYFDEEKFTKTVISKHSQGLIKFDCPKYHLYHSYDRIPSHIPKPQLEIAPDGSLFELQEDIVTHRKVGREIMVFHFSYTKRWPL